MGKFRSGLLIAMVVWSCPAYAQTSKLTGTVFVVNGYWHLADANQGTRTVKQTVLLKTYAI